MKNNHVSGKIDVLKSIISSLGPMSVAFSGGVDSTFLLHMAVRVLGDQAQAIIAKSPVFPAHEENEALAYLKNNGICFHVVEPALMRHADFVENGKNRCYVCKNILFKAVCDKTIETGKRVVAHGVNLDDFKDYRPGLKAASELGVVSPLADAGFEKQDVRDASRIMGLPTADKPAMACLASRIPYGETLTLEKLRQVEKAETLLRSLGFDGGRARYHGSLVRIEIPRHGFERILSDPVRTVLIDGLKQMGFFHISLDLEGYTQGSMNRVLFDEG